METVALLIGLVIGAGAVWVFERYHEKREDELLNIMGQLQMKVEQLSKEVERLQEPPIPEEEM